MIRLTPHAATFSQSVEKLAVLLRNRYINRDFGGVDWPPLGYLKTPFSSPSGGENPATQALQRIAGRFGSAAKLVGGSLLVGSSLAMPALAKDSSSQTVSAPTLTSVIEGGYDCELSQIGTNFRVPTLREPDFSKNGIRAVAAVRSRQGIVPTVYGSDQLLGQIVARAVNDARECGANVKGVIIGARSEVGGIDIYGGGALLHEVGGITEQLDLQNAPYVQQQVLRTLLIADATLKETQTAQLSDASQQGPASGL